MVQWSMSMQPLLALIRQRLGSIEAIGVTYYATPFSLELRGAIYWYCPLNRLLND